MCTGLGLSACKGEESLYNGLREYLQYAGEAHYRFQANLMSSKALPSYRICAGCRLWLVVKPCQVIQRRE